MEKSSLVQQARVLVQEHIQKKNQRPATLARMLEISPSQINHLMNKPDLLSEEVLMKIVNKLLPKTRFNTVGTSNFETIQNVCREGKDKHRMVCIIGYPGAGKTVGLDHFYRNNSNTYLVECNSIMNRKQFFAEILIKMGVSFQGGLYDMIKTIAHELNTRESPLLILDEASKLRMNIMLDLHWLRNATMNNAGIILAGCEYFIENLKNAAQKQRQGIPELYSRIQAKYDLSLPTKKEIEAICMANGVTEPTAIKELQTLRNYRHLSNAILNENDLTLSL